MFCMGFFYALYLSFSSFEFPPMGICCQIIEYICTRFQSK